MITRRQFMKTSAGAAAAIATHKMWLREAYAQYGVNSPPLQKFVDPMRMVGVDIPLALPDGTTAPITGVAHYTIDIGEFTDTLHSQMPTSLGTPGALTRLWGYRDSANAKPFTHLGGVIVATKNTPIQLTFNNNLPASPIVPVDTTLPGANTGFDHAAVHLHGGFIPWISDGGPFDWWAPNGTSGLSFINNRVLNPANINTNKAEYYYPNTQTDRFMWYHDHAFGITRTNAYSGIASGYVLLGPEEASLVALGVPSAVDLYHPTALPNGGMIYLVFQDKIFVPPAGVPVGYPVAVNAGDLFYPYIYDLALFGALGIPSFGGALLTPLPVPSTVPEMFGDTALVNGTAFPVLEVQPRLYRIRMLNACNSRFLNPRLVATAGTVFPQNAEPNTKAPGPSFIQIGTEGGFLPAPVLVNGTKQLQLLIAPAERADLLVDFTGIAPGTEFILYNDAPGPFPGGAAIFDYNPKNPKTPVSTPGFGPNTRTLMKFRVVAGAGPAMPATISLAGLNDPPIVAQTAGVPIVPVINLAAGTATIGATTYPLRQLTLNEGFDEYGRLAQFIGTNAAVAPGFFGKRYLDPTTENPVKNATEVWQIANLTADSHPIHFHLVNVQILARQAFNPKNFNGFVALQGKPVAPDANELGWKETVRMNPGEVIWVIMKFSLPVIVNSTNAPVDFSAVNNGNVGQVGGLGTPPPSPRTGGNEYVYHCHILEHEEHDMMRPLVVT
ncbi:MAG TPA: multicopper oxidase domain-containing protein [Candidatus Methylomirabilis sp.]|nr:multicopper oxidase domain-containing protein [Candidatus Methylomirabilis sp.]